METSSIEPAAGPPTNLVQSPIQTSSARLEWPRHQDCNAILDEVTALHAKGQLAAMSGTAPLAFLIDDPNLSLIGDWPIPVTSQSQASVFDCLIIIGEAEMAPVQPRQVISDRKLRSSYPSGTKRVANANYIEPQAGRSAKGSAYSSQIIQTGDPMLDIVGTLADTVLFGIDTFASGDAKASVGANSEPKYFEEPRLIPYSYRLAELEASRSARLPLTLINQKLQARTETQIALRETEIFALSDDVHPDDPEPQFDPSARLVTSLQLARWEASPPSLSVSGLITHLRAVGSDQSKPEPANYQPRKLFGAGQASSIAPSQPLPLAFLDISPQAGKIRQSSLSIEGATDDPKSGVHVVPEREMVRILGDSLDTEAGAFFVSKAHLIAPNHAMPGTSLVSLTYPDGVKVFGLVEKRDPDMGLALVFTPREGVPFKIAEASEGLTDRVGSLSGQPILQGSEIAGVWVSDPVQGWRFLTSTDIRKFTNHAGLSTLLN